MGYQRSFHQVVAAMLVMVLLVGCAAPATTRKSEVPISTPAPALTPTPEPTPIPVLFPIYQNDQSGYIDASGQMITPLQFESTGAFSEGLAAVQSNSLWGYIDATGAMVIQPQFERAGTFSEGLAAVRIGSLWGYIDTEGTMVIQPQFTSAWNFHDDRAKIGTDEKYGYINSAGNVVVAPEYDDGSDFSEGMASVMKCTAKKPCQIFTFSGEWGTISNTTGGAWGFIDLEATTVISSTFDAAGNFSEGLAPIKTGESWGYIDQTGAVIFQPQYKNASDFSEELAAVKIDETWGYMDKTGAIAIPAQFTGAHSFSEGLAAVSTGQGIEAKFGYIDTTGAMVIQPQFILAEDFSEGLAEVWLEDENGDLAMAYINKTGETIWKPSPSTQSTTEATPTSELPLPPIPEEFLRTNEADCEWQDQILGSWSRASEEQSTETVTFKPDNTLFFTYIEKPDEIRVGTYICEKGGTLKIFTQSYVAGKPDWLVVLGKIEVTFPSTDTLMMKFPPDNQVQTYERVIE